MNNSLHISNSLIGTIVNFHPEYNSKTKKIELTKTGVILACFVANDKLLKEKLFVVVRWNKSLLTMNIEECVIG